MLERSRVRLAAVILVALAAPSSQIPRPKKRDPHTCSANRESGMAAKEFVLREIRSHNIVVFSKTYCSFSKKAKSALFSLLAKDDVTIVEADLRPDTDGIQDALLEITGGRSVPRVFIKGKFFGGGDDTAAAASNGKLKSLLQSEGIL